MEEKVTMRLKKSFSNPWSWNEGDHGNIIQTGTT